jgi:hypothetical protein
MTTDSAIATAGESGFRPRQTARSIELRDAGNTLPFIAR